MTTTKMALFLDGHPVFKHKCYATTNNRIKALTSCSTHKIDQQETDKNQNTTIQILGESSTNQSCIQKYFAN